MEFLQRKPHPKDVKTGSGKYSMDNPEYRKAYQEMMEKAKGRDVRYLAAERHKALRLVRLTEHRPDVVAMSAALRAVMTREING